MRSKLQTMAPTYEEMMSQLQASLDKLEKYKASNQYLQFQIMKQELRNHLAEQENRTLKDQKREHHKMLSNKDKEISHLKSHKQNLEEKIRNSKNVEESPYRSNNDIEEEIKRLKKIIKEKDDEIKQIQRKIRCLEA